MTACEPLNGARRFDEDRQRVREVYLQGVSDIMDACLAEFLMPADKETIAHDAVQFTVFLMVLKIAEARGTGVDRFKLLTIFRLLAKELEREVPGMILEYAREHGAPDATA